MPRKEYSLAVSEMSHTQVTWEICVGGQAYHWIYIVTDEDYSLEHEGFIGYILNYDGTFAFFGKPTSFIFDGHLYTAKIEEEEVEKIVGKELLKWHKDRMQALLVLRNGEASKPKGKCVKCKTFMTEGTYGGEPSEGDYKGKPLCDQCFDEEFPFNPYY